jgi:DNA-binding beta-propeller fold protein YncE
MSPTLKAYTAIVPGSLCAPPVATDLVSACKDPQVQKTPRVADLHDKAWWAKATVGMDFSKPDRVNPQYFNRILEYGLTGRGSLPQAVAGMLDSKNYDADDDGK